MARPGVETAGKGEALDPQFLETRFMMGSPNPFRPVDDIQVAKDAGSVSCPSTLCQEAKDQNGNPVTIYLYPVSENEQKDALLICNRCGYEVVYRVKTGKFESRPGRVYPEGFLAPKMKVQRPIPVKPERTPRARKAKHRRPRPAPLNLGPSPVEVSPGVPPDQVSTISTAEAALLLKLTEKQVRRAVRKGKLEGSKVDGAIRIRVTAIAEYLRG